MERKANPHRPIKRPASTHCWHGKATALLSFGFASGGLGLECLQWPSLILPSCGHKAGAFICPPVPHVFLVGVFVHEVASRMHQVLQAWPEPSLKVLRRLQDVLRK